MAYEIWDGFDDYDLSHELWEFVNNTPSYSTSFARFTALPNCISKGVSFGNNTWKRKNLAGNRPSLVVSMAFSLTSFASGNCAILSFQDNGTMQCNISVGSTGALVVRQGNGTSTNIQGLTASGLITFGTFYFLDVLITFGNGTGACSLYLSTPAGGSPVLSLSSINNIATANAYANQVAIGEQSGQFTTILVDDFHCHTASGGTPNSVLGEGTRILTKMPNGAGYATTLTPNGAAANWQCVDDAPPDDDTTYVSAGSFPLTEGYAIGAAGFTGVVNGVVRKSRFRKDDGAAHTFENGVRSSSTNVLSSPANAQSGYTWLDAIFIQDPSTSAAWTASGADAAQPIISAVS